MGAKVVLLAKSLIPIFLRACAIVHWMLSNVLLNRLVEKKHNYTGCNCLIFLHCVFYQMHPQIACLREWEVECVNASSVCLHEKLYSHTDYITAGQQFEDIFDKTQRRQPMWLNLDNQLQNTIDNAQCSQKNENQGTLRQPFVDNIWIFTVEMKNKWYRRDPKHELTCAS